MQKLLSQTLLLLTVLLALTAAGCSSDSATAETGEEAAAANKAICLWDKAGLRETPGNDGKFLTNVAFGESLTLTGKRQEAPAEKRTYLEVSTSDGKIGWISDYLVAEKATLGAAIAEASVYKRPDMATLTDDALKPGEVVAILEEKDGFVNIVGKQRQRKGWIKGTESLLTAPEDVTLALLYTRAMAGNNADAQRKQLEKLQANTDFKSSMFMTIINDKVQTLAALPPLSEDELYIVGDRVNVRTEPKLDAAVAFQLGDATVCAVVGQSEVMDINGTKDRWYQIEAEGKTGWVFGKFTSRKAE